jgi:RNA polymerase sigma factor (sigma-70 family)
MSSQSKAIELLYEYHNEFISAARSVLVKTNFPISIAEDLVQDAYIKLAKQTDIYDKIVVDGEVKKGYMFFAVRSVALDYVRDNRKELSNVELIEELDKPEDSLPDDLEFSEFKSSMLSFLRIQLVDEKDWFHLRVFEKYLDSGLTYEELADSIGIGTQTVYKSVKKCKDILQDGFYLDYKEFLNGR